MPDATTPERTCWVDAALLSPREVGFAAAGRFGWRLEEGRVSMPLHHPSLSFVRGYLDERHDVVWVASVDGGEELLEIVEPRLEPDGDEFGTYLVAVWDELRWADTHERLTDGEHDYWADAVVDLVRELDRG